jgi:hypothetical protein
MKKAKEEDNKSGKETEKDNEKEDYKKGAVPG